MFVSRCGYKPLGRFSSLSVLALAGSSPTVATINSKITAKSKCMKRRRIKVRNVSSVQCKESNFNLGVPSMVTAELVSPMYSTTP